MEIPDKEDENTHKERTFEAKTGEIKKENISRL